MKQFSKMKLTTWTFLGLAAFALGGVLIAGGPQTGSKRLPENVPNLQKLIAAYKGQGGQVAPNTPKPELIRDTRRIAQARKARRQYADGFQLYTANCAACHGNRGQGRYYKSLGVNPAFSGYTAPVWKRKAALNDLANRVNAGSAGLIKPAFDHLSGAQWDELAGYLYVLSQ